MFSLVNGMLLRPLPYPDPDRIVRVLERLPSGGLTGVSTLNYLDWTKQNTVFEYMAAEAGWRATLTGGPEPVLIQAARASAHYFDIFGVKPALGRTFLPDEDQIGKDRVVLLSHALWESRFSADSSVLQRDIRLDGEPYTVVGVLPKGGPFDRASAQLWTPLAFQPSNSRRDFRWLGASAKLKPRVTLERARAEMDVIGTAPGRRSCGRKQGPGCRRRPPFRRTRRPGLAYCRHGPVRRHWPGVADRLRQPGESCACTQHCARTRDGGARSARCGSLASGTTVPHRTRRALCVRWHRGRRRRLRHDEVDSVVDSSFRATSRGGHRIDTSALLFTLIVAIGTGLLFGIVPAVRSTNPRLVGALTHGGHATTADTPARRIRSVLVVAEIALAFVLLVGSGQLMRSFFNLLEVDLGFIAANVLTAGLPVTQKQHPDPVELNTYLASIRAAVEAIPGVRETAITSVLPLRGWGYGLPYTIAGRQRGSNVSSIGILQDRQSVLLPRTGHQAACGTRVERQRPGGHTARRTH
jgi:putative ABC transport system permease protein